MALLTLSIDMYLPSLPAIRASLHNTTSSVQLTLESFMAAWGLGKSSMGRRPSAGRRAPLFWGVGWYAVASVGCAMARDVTVLGALRFLRRSAVRPGP